MSKSTNSGVVAWVAYDFINSLIIINGSIYYSAWITQKQGVSSFWYGTTFAISTIVLLALLPIKGAAIDRHSIGRQLLFALSFLIGLAAFILPDLGHRTSPFWRIGGTLIVFGLINLFYQASFVPYNWLIVHLRGVKSPEDVRRVSGLGESFGSLGSVVGALLGIALLKTFLQGESAYIDLFRWLGILFLLLFFIDYSMLKKGIVMRPGESESYSTLLREGFKLFKEKRTLRRFLLAFLLYADALLTVQLYLPIYMRERMALSDTALTSAFVLALLAGALGAFLFSTLGRRKGPKSIIIVCLLGWSLTLFLFGLVSSKSLFFLLMTCAGILYGILWSASRAYLVELVPVTVLGRTFGFFAVFERCASVIGPLIWGAIMLLPFSLFWRYFGAFSAMSFIVGLSVIFLRPQGGSSVELSKGNS